MHANHADRGVAARFRVRRRHVQADAVSARLVCLVRAKVGVPGGGDALFLFSFLSANSGVDY